MGVSGFVRLASASCPAIQLELSHRIGQSDRPSEAAAAEKAAAAAAEKEAAKFETISQLSPPAPLICAGQSQSETRSERASGRTGSGVSSWLELESGPGPEFETTR